MCNKSVGARERVPPGAALYCILAEDSLHYVGLLNMLFVWPKCRWCYGTLGAAIALQFVTLYQLCYSVALKMVYPSRLNFGCHVYIQKFRSGSSCG